MKKINYYLGTLALAAMTLASCSSDEPMKGIDPGKVDVDQVRYLNVTIATPNPAGSRADFQDAVGDENFVHDMYFVFYDANGAVLNWHHVDSYTNNDGPEFSKPGTNGSVDKIWTSTVPVELKVGQNMPAYVMAFINPVTPDELLNYSLSQLETVRRRQVVADDGHFPMSNSVYYGTNPITGQQQVRMVATPITTTQLFTDYTKASEYPSVEIYVERYAARIDLTLATPTTTIEPNTKDVNGWTLKFVPEYWRPNAIDVEEYVVKHYAYKPENGTINTDPSYSLLNGATVLGGWTWNDATLCRSYWGCSPAYYAGTYPKVSDNITDLTDDGSKPINTYPLHYFNYNEISQSKILSGEYADAPLRESIEFTTTGPNPGFSGSFYARESTAAAAAWKNATAYNPAAVVTSAVIVGRYVINNGTDQPANTTFYLYGKTDNKYNLYLEDEIAGAMMANQQIILDATTHTPIKTITTANANDFTVEHPSQAVREEAEATVAGRFVALQMALDNDGNPATGYVYYDANATGNKYIPITSANVEEVNAMLLTAGYARKYGKGLAYFSIPIQHLGFEATSVDAKGVLDYTKCRAGSFGLVRNHLYQININSIKGLATALRDENQPIVPPMDEQTYYISAKLNVLNWRLVNPQNVDL